MCVRRVMGVGNRSLESFESVLSMNVGGIVTLGHRQYGDL
jgi:hypothetical protein